MQINIEEVYFVKVQKLKTADSMQMHVTFKA